MMDYSEPRRNHYSMAKFIFSIGAENFRLLVAEAKTRDITIQELIRAVIIPDWMKHNFDPRSLREAPAPMSNTTGILNHNSVPPSSIGRLKP